MTIGEEEEEEEEEEGDDEEEEELEVPLLLPTSQRSLTSLRIRLRTPPRLTPGAEAAPRTTMGTRTVIDGFFFFSASAAAAAAAASVVVEGAGRRSSSLEEGARGQSRKLTFSTSPLTMPRCTCLGSTRSVKNGFLLAAGEDEEEEDASFCSPRNSETPTPEASAAASAAALTRTSNIRAPIPLRPPWERRAASISEVGRESVRVFPPGRPTTVAGTRPDCC